jgi:hypothetical protein
MQQFILFMAILFILCGANLFAQDSTRANLFQLHDGDYWEYDSHLPWSFPDTFFTASRRVIGDTLMPNGKTYKYIRETDFNYDDGRLFLRIDDSLNVLEFQRILNNTFENVIFKLNAEIGESWFPAIDSATISQVVDIYDVFAIGKVRRVMEIHEESYPFAIVFWDYTLMEEIGLVPLSGEGFFWSFRGAIINGKEFGNITSIEEREEVIPGLFELYQNYPNPFNAETTIRYRLTRAAKIQITIYDVTGGEVITLVDEENRVPGDYSVTWNGKNQKGGDVASGIYFYQLRAGNFVESKKALLIK